MKVLVIGGNKYFGKRLAKLLVDSEHDVTMLNRGSRDDGLSDRVQRIQCDRNMLTTETLQGQSWDIVFDQICYNANQARQAKEVFSGRVGHYVFTSSQSVYDAGSALSESVFDPTQYEFDKVTMETENYAEAKRQCESVFSQGADFPLTSLRLSIVLGPDDTTGRLWFHLERILNRQEVFFSNLDAKLSLISSECAARSLFELGMLPPQGPVNACSKDPIVLRDLVSLLGQSLEKPMRLAEAEAEGNKSPFGIPSDWYMTTEKLNSLGIHLPGIEDWLPKACKELAASKAGPESSQAKL